MFMQEPDPWGAATNYLNELRIQSFNAAQAQSGGGGAAIDEEAAMAVVAAAALAACRRRE